MKNKITIVLILILNVNSVFSQFTELSQVNLRIGTTGAYQAIRFDVEAKIQEKWFLIAPKFYFKSSEDFYYYDAVSYKNDFDRFYTLNAGGFDFYYKKYINTKSDFFKPYYAYGGGYMYHEINYSEWEWFNGTEYNRTYYHYHYKRVKQYVNSFSINALAGIMLEPAQSVYIDLYFGLGFKYSHIKANNLISKPILQDFMEPAHTGAEILFGLRIGISFIE